MADNGGISVSFVRRDGKAEYAQLSYASRTAARLAADQVLKKVPGLYIHAIIHEDRRAVEFIAAEDGNQDSPVSGMSELLKQELEAARRRLQVATETFKEIIGEIPSGLPHPDGTQLIANASAECSSARREFIRALQRLNDYVLHGKTSEDSAATEIQ